MEEQIQLKKRKMFVVGEIFLYYVMWLITLMVIGFVAYAGFGSFLQKYILLGLLLNGVSICISAVIPAWVMLRLVENKPFISLGLSLKGRGKDIVYGMLVALAIYVVGFGVCILTGAVEIADVSFHPLQLLAAFVIFAFGAFGEEVMMRGYILRRLLDARMNRFIALFLSSFLFALAHIFNPNLAFIPMLNLLMAGFLLGAAYIYTRNLWFAFSLHTFWNWIQGSVLGYQVSGINFGTSVITQRLPENNLLNGGGFGFEGSIICTVLTTAAALGIIWYYERKKATPVVADLEE